MDCARECQGFFFLPPQIWTGDNETTEADEKNMKVESRGNEKKKNPNT